MKRDRIDVEISSSGSESECGHQHVTAATLSHIDAHTNSEIDSDFEQSSGTYTDIAESSESDSGTGEVAERRNKEREERERARVELRPDLAERFLSSCVPALANAPNNGYCMHGTQGDRAQTRVAIYCGLCGIFAETATAPCIRGAKCILSTPGLGTPRKQMVSPKLLSP